MALPQDISQMFSDWARDAFLQEIRTSFSRAQTCDTLMARIMIDVLRELPSDQLQLLSEVLPNRAGSVEQRMERLGLDGRRAAENYLTVRNRVLDRRRLDIAKYIRTGVEKETKEEARKICILAEETVLPKIAREWGCKMSRVELGAWRLSQATAWGEVSVTFVSQQTLELSYTLQLKSNQVTGLPNHDHYLGRLGIGPSSWWLSSVESCAEKFRAAGDLIRWHIGEYARIMEKLPRK